jgi:NitT/TauT family transport system substrate-binding protein
MSSLRSGLVREHGSAAGNLITLVLLVGIVGLGAWLWLGNKSEDKGDVSAQTSSQGSDGGKQAKPDSTVAAPQGDAPTPIEPVIGTR